MKRFSEQPETAFGRRIPGGRAASLVACVLLFLSSSSLLGETSLPEYQVKALFLFNFIRYVDWPATDASTNGPAVIGILGEDDFQGNLTRAVLGKSSSGRSVMIKHLSANNDLSGCMILFVSSSKDAELAEILTAVGNQPILTVGESGSFLQKGGMINFILKDGKIHLQINLKAARKGNLQISSKLLSVAEIVRE